MNKFAIINHVLDEEAGVYRLQFAPIHTETLTEYRVSTEANDNDPLQVSVEEIPVEHETVGEEQTIVWAATDERWFDADGNRRPADEVAEEQRKEALRQMKKNARKRGFSDRNEVPMPGIGMRI